MRERERVNWEVCGETPAAICTVDLTTFGVVAGAERACIEADMQMMYRAFFWWRCVSLDRRAMTGAGRLRETCTHGLGLLFDSQVVNNIYFLICVRVRGHNTFSVLTSLILAVFPPVFRSGLIACPFANHSRCWCPPGYLHVLLCVYRYRIESNVIDIFAELPSSY